MKLLMWAILAATGAGLLTFAVVGASAVIAIIQHASHGF